MSYNNLAAVLPDGGAGKETEGFKVLFWSIQLAHLICRNRVNAPTAEDGCKGHFSDSTRDEWF